MFLFIVDNGWMLRGRRIWYSMHSVQSARPGCRCCRTCTLTWCDGAPRRIGCVARRKGPIPLSRGRRPVEERRARDSLAYCQSHGMYLANLIVRLCLRTGRSAHASKVGQHLACREERRVSAVSGDPGVSPSIVIYYKNGPGLSSKKGGERQACAFSFCQQKREDEPLAGLQGSRLVEDPKGENRACRLHVVSDGSCTSCVCV
jgi:hypothetical protein